MSDIDTLGPLRDALDGLAFAAHETYTLSGSADVQAWIAKVMECAAVEVAKARADELERCAKLCANLVAPFGLSDSQRSVYDTATIDCEAAIRGVYPHRLASRPI